ncbi:MAG TPA: TonB-dependent receptor [Gemmatimonadaceae bacterium]|nr:TonB-dependent receptor [Gemmatimonadaceae bacterium]
MPLTFGRCSPCVAAALLATTLAPSSARAQDTGTITGTVTAAPAGSPLAAVRITVTGTTRAAVTDERGHYRLVGLAPGQYVLTASRVGYEPRSRSVQLAGGGSAAADFTLREGTVLLSDVVVSTTRTAEPATQVAATVNVMSREQIRTSPARAADDLLREMPGVELPRTSSTVSGAEEIVSIRGADEGRTLVLLDGVPLNDPWGEWIQWNRAPRFRLDRAEVVEGGGSSLYGNYAMGGVIALYSQPIVRRGYDLMASAGSRDAADFSAYASDVRGRLGLSLGGDYGSGGGYTVLRESQRGPVDRPSTVERYNLEGRAEYALGGGTLFASGNYFADDRSLGTEFTGPNRRHIAGGVLGGSFGSVGGGRLELRLYGQRQRYDSRSAVVAAGRIDERPNVEQHIPSHDLGGSVQWTRRAGIFDAISVGGDYRLMVGRLDEDVYGTSGSITGTRTSGGRQQVGGVYVQGVIAPVEPLRVEASARFDAWRSYDGSRTDATTATPTTTVYEAKSNSAFAPRLGVRWSVLPAVTLRGSYYQAFRAPTLSEEYRTFFAGPNTFMGNPALTPEHLVGYDAGLDFRPHPAVELRATVFWNFYRDLDDFVFREPGPAPGSAVLQRQNVGRARSNGVEGELALRPIEPVTLAFTYNYDHARVTSTGKPVNRVPLQRSSARLTVASERIATLTAIYRMEGESHALGGVPLPSFEVVDLDARRTLFRGTEAFVSVENLFDREYVVNVSGTLESVGLPRTIRGGLAVRSF